MKRSHFLDQRSDASTDLPIALYHAFTRTPYSGSPAAIILNAQTLNQVDRAQTARELGLPATAFVEEVGDNRVVVQFFSAVMELPMCGHGTLCLVSSLCDSGLLVAKEDTWTELTLVLPKGEAQVVYRLTQDERTEVLLDVAPAKMERPDLDEDRLAFLLGVSRGDFSKTTPLAVARADFIHLCLPMAGLTEIGKITPDFAALAEFCRENGLETVAAYTTETVDASNDIHVRDFCPAVGVSESAAAGTTNAALAACLMDKRQLQPISDGRYQVRAEQGIELGRPSQITSHIEANNGEVRRLQVGGIASRVMVGYITPLTHSGGGVQT